MFAQATGTPARAIGQSPFRFGFSCYEQRHILLNILGSSSLRMSCATKFVERTAQPLAVEVFSELMRLGCEPGPAAPHREAFWRGWRLLALEARSSADQHAQIKATMRKAKEAWPGCLC